MTYLQKITEIAHGPFVISGAVFLIIVLALILLRSPRWAGDIHFGGQAAAVIDTGFIRLVMQILISGVVLIVAFYIILASADEGGKKWAYGAVGSVVAFWLKG